MRTVVVVAVHEVRECDAPFVLGGVADALVFVADDLAQLLTGRRVQIASRGGPSRTRASCRVLRR